MTCNIQKSFWHECGHCLSEVTHCHTCPIFGGVDQHICSDGPSRCPNIRTSLAYKSGHCSLCHAREGQTNPYPLSRGLDHRLPTALIEQHRAEFTLRLQEQAERDRAQHDPRAAWHAEQELNCLLQAEDGIHPLNQNYVFDPDHHPESSCFLEKVRDLEAPCPICKVSASESKDARRLPCRHTLHFKCILPWFLELEQNHCPTCYAEFQIIRAPAFNEDPPSGCSVEGVNAPVGSLSFSERVSKLSWKR
ncbi:hypothetical protein N431DRAFT_326846 [Stipitochalara longipes BDJ]|nr:hypothetical protein N431DRAFT_326846 [Stipitochalara longipes BDJ]